MTARVKLFIFALGMLGFIGGVLMLLSARSIAVRPAQSFWPVLAAVFLGIAGLGGITLGVTFILSRLLGDALPDQNPEEPGSAHKTNEE
jgi:hypothetical protein